MTHTHRRSARVQAANRILATGRTPGTALSLHLGPCSLPARAGDPAIRIDPAKPLGRIADGLHGHQ